MTVICFGGSLEFLVFIYNIIPEMYLWDVEILS